MIGDAAVEFSDDPGIAAAVFIKVHMIGCIYFVNPEIRLCAVDAKLGKDRISEIAVEWIGLSKMTNIFHKLFSMQ